MSNSEPTERAGGVREALEALCDAWDGRNDGGRFRGNVTNATANGRSVLDSLPPAASKPQTWRDLDDARLQLSINAFYEPCEGTTIDGVRAAILAWEQSR